MDMEILARLDTQLFFFINHLPHAVLTNELASFISGLGESGFIWFCIGAWFIFRGERRDHRFFLPLAGAAAIGWILSELILKPMVARIRPSSILDEAIVYGGFPIGYSFPSTHTVFAFALATVLAYREPKGKTWFYALAWLVGFSRIYLGHHYPIDVIAGGLLGWGIGYATVYWYKNYIKQKKHKVRVRRV